MHQLAVKFIELIRCRWIIAGSVDMWNGLSSPFHFGPNLGNSLKEAWIFKKIPFGC